MPMKEIREADLTRDLQAIRGLWLDYLTWGNAELEAKHGIRMPVHEMVERDLENIARFQPPGGQIFLAFVENAAVGIACLQRIGPTTAEVKRMYVRPENRREGLGRALLERLMDTAGSAGYRSIRLDSPDFMTAAHALYRSNGFADIASYPESEIPEEYRGYWVFMERNLG
jgi:GNAT superfamily N-acetyltransferase